MNITTIHSPTSRDRWTRFLGFVLTVILLCPVVAMSQSPAPVNLGTAGNFEILAKTGISSTGTTHITGDCGISPAAATYITGFGLIMDPSGIFSTSSLVTGKIYAANYASPTPANMTTAVSDMETAYTDAAGRTLPDYTELYAGDLTGRTLTPGLYKWGTGVLISAGGVTISGSPGDVWIFQIAQNLTLANGAIVTLSGGAQASNIFWQVAGQAILGTTAAMKGNILCQTAIVMTNRATLDGRAFAQTAVTLDANSVGLLIPGDTIHPAVSSTNPADSASGVAINKKITAIFSEAMDPLTINTGTFVLTQGTTPVTGAVTYTGTTATFSPAGVLAAGTAYGAVIKTGAKDLAGNALPQNYSWSFTTGAAPDTIRPVVSSTDPNNAATGVAINKKIAATFTEAMDPSTVNATTFLLTQGTTPVAGTVTYAGTTAIFAPANPLVGNTAYTAAIAIGARDLAGNALLRNYSWNFTTGPAPDTTPPAVSSTDPADAAIDVPFNKIIAATFSEAMDPLTINTTTFLLNMGITPVAGTVTYTGTTATFSPASPLGANTGYTATMTSGVGDLAGNPLPAAYSWSFTTGTSPDKTPPRVIATDPADAAVGVAVRRIIRATFSETMNPATIGAATFLVDGPGVMSVVGTVEYDPATGIAAFTPAGNLAADNVYRVTITTGARDLANNALAGDHIWSFRTGASTVVQQPVGFGSAAAFAVLAGTTVTCTGPVTINGDLGVSPGTTITGSPTVNGTIHAGDSVAANGQLDLSIAYFDATERTAGSVPVSGNLGGQTLSPGLYTSASSLEISSGDLTLDARGDAGAVFIFQMGTTLTMTSGRRVILSNGARAGNIVWQVGSSATLGTTSVFKGNILALTSITLNTGATVEGRLLARNGAVTFDGNIVIRPTVTAVEAGSTPDGVILSQNYPNPFTPSTWIQYRLAAAAQVSLRIYTLLGHEVATLVNGRQEAGTHMVQFTVGEKARNLMPGTYVYLLEAGNIVVSKKLILIR